jgi:probable regulatory domain-containing protein
MAILTPEEIREFDIDAMAIRVFLKSLELIGGPRKLIEYRNLTWIPSLMEASYAVVLQDMANKTEAEIAEFLGSTRQTVRNMLRAEPELVLKKLEGELEEKTPRAHTAGGLAKLAYKEIKEGRENLTMFLHLLQVASESLGVFWPVEILKRMRGADFPLGKEELLERLKGLKVKEKNIEEILEKLSYPVKSPADLLAQIRENLEAQ